MQVTASILSAWQKRRRSATRNTTQEEVDDDPTSHYQHRFYLDFWYLFCQGSTVQRIPAGLVIGPSLHIRVSERGSSDIDAQSATMRTVVATAGPQQCLNDEVLRSEIGCELDTQFYHQTIPMRCLRTSTIYTSTRPAPIPVDRENTYTVRRPSQYSILAISIRSASVS